MADNPYEIPPEMRDFAEKSVDQAKKAFDGFMNAAHKAAGGFNLSSEAMHSGTKDIGHKALGYAEQNVNAALDFAARLVSARDPQEILKLQSDFLRTQAQAFGEQAKEIGTAAAKIAVPPEAPKTRGDKARGDKS
jgi:phasin